MTIRRIYHHIFSHFKTEGEKTINFFKHKKEEMQF